jgi:hypothetical protein
VSRRKLTATTWYEYVDGYAVIYARRKDTRAIVPAFTCHSSCIPIIQAQGLNAPDVVLRVYKKE